MSREFEKVTRVEDKKFAAPAPVAVPNKLAAKEPDTVRFVSELAVKAASHRLRHFYPKGTQQLAEKILNAAAPHMKSMERASSKSITDKAVNAGGEAIYSSETGQENWSELDDRMQKIYEEDAKGALEAVILYLNISSK